MNYTLNQLQIFLKVSQTLSVTKAAEELHLTQPAVSIQLKNFQDQFELPLTEVIGKRIYITDFGKEIAASAEKVITQVQSINNRTMAFKGQLTGRLKISVVSTGKYVMPFFLADFMQANPGVDLLMDVTNKETVVKSLANNEVDFALVSILPKNMPVEQLQLLQNKLYLVGKQNPLQGKNSKAPDFFSRFPLIYRENGSGTRQVMEGFIAGNHIPVLKKMELTTNEAVKQAVLAGLGYSVMPLIGLKNELINRELHIIPFKGLPITTTWSLVWLKGKKHTQVSQAFLAYLKKHKTEIIAEQFKWYEVYK